MTDRCGLDFFRVDEMTAQEMLTRILQPGLASLGKQMGWDLSVVIHDNKSASIEAKKLDV